MTKRILVIPLVGPVVLITALFGVAAFACSRPPNPKQTLRFHNMAEPRTLDPAGATGIPEKNLLLALAEGLTSLDPKTSAATPGVAERFVFSADGKTLTFYLRSCVWSNGDPVTAGDFKDSWLRVLDPATASPLATLLFGIAGAREYHEGTADAARVGIVVSDPRTLIVKFIAPQPWFLQLAASSPFTPVHRSMTSSPRGFVHSKYFTGNGPFVLEERIPNFRIVMKKNPNYWDSANVTIETIIAYSTENKQTAVDAFRAGRTDWVDDFPGAQAASWIGKPELRISPYLGIYFLRFNTTKPPLHDARVRRAIHLAIDRTAICKNVTKLGQTPAAGFVPKCIETLGDYKSFRGELYNPETARSLLAAAGYPGGKGFPRIEYQFDTSDDHKRIAEAVQAMLKENLGVDVFLVNKEKKVVIDDEENLRYAGLSRGSWIADYTDPATFLDIFETGAPSNRTGFTNKEYDQLLAEARACGDAGKRMQLLSRAEQILMEREFPVTPIYEYVKQTLVNPQRVAGGFYENPMGFHPMKWIRLKE